jgi:hypothetical protein
MAWNAKTKRYQISGYVYSAPLKKKMQSGVLLLVQSVKATLHELGHSFSVNEKNLEYTLNRAATEAELIPMRMSILENVRGQINACTCMYELD